MKTREIAVTAVHAATPAEQRQHSGYCSCAISQQLANCQLCPAAAAQADTAQSFRRLLVASVASGSHHFRFLSV